MIDFTQINGRFPIVVLVVVWVQNDFPLTCDRQIVFSAFHLTGLESGPRWAAKFGATDKEYREHHPD